ncbi:ZYRO0D01276p [Zygosaccharomyces rouxii]|uniref:ZYRO0D01276p n=1 Tax=Zygosaccharomyces rouxii (strain ATCC 2623 / CBS 732 / NBRC 1130 / NCYC 568 / NRRL Y-229) TaxID=559307 RepID=C5DUT7_ZYGRC|nr:uncharacterized protein ZYRO0D01276g [Zygosaccharomyces rouxii]KAH9200473.1 hypothetical protein LQ764DRAFT_233784 [Zygosaccharomyces rouxii]CAR27556.1 ZYRO0D01276p [Zygosaccharomyces rouxii]
MGRSAELEEFLKRVEDYDLQRRGNNDVTTTAGATNNEMNGGYSEESLERARKLLSENGVAIVDGESRKSTLDAPELAYRSAYNYERTFSPKRVTTNSKTYTVSEDDYLLLQRLKAKEKPPAPLPPHEKSRDNDRLRKLLDGVTTPSFPKTTTSLPSSSYYSTNLESRKTEAIPAVTSRSRGPPPVPPKSRSRAKDESENIEPEKDVGKPISPPRSPSSSPPSSPTKSPYKVELKSSPKKFNLKAELEPSKKTLALDNGKSSSPNKESPSSLSSHLDFLDSVQRNKVEPNLETPKNKSPIKSSSLHSNQFIDSAAHKSTPPAKPNKPLELANTPKSSLQRTRSGSFINSALKSPVTQPTASSASPTIFKIPSKPSTESFINSALKASPPPPPKPARKPTTIVKPRPLSKPASLRKSSTAPEDGEFRPEKPAGLAQLRPTGSNEKPKPHVPPKKSELVLPKLRHVDRTDSHGNKINSEADFTAKLKKTTPPEVPKKNPSLPEALKRLSNLSKAAPPPKPEEDVPEALTKVGHLSRAAPPPKRAEDVPEALAHLEKLNKVSKQPPVPTRKISMGEALQKAQELKKQQQKQSQSSEGEQKPKDVKSELGAVLMAQKLRASKPLLSGSSSTEPSSTNSSTTSLSSSNSSNTLSHANKTRSKGPKRRIPSTIKM